jgi:hypothetical protein
VNEQFEVSESGGRPGAADERDALDRLSRVHGQVMTSAAILGLVARVQPDAESWPALRTAILAETGDGDAIRAVAADVGSLSAASRLPVLDAFLRRRRHAPKDERRALLQSTRRVMAARAAYTPLDRLIWLAMRKQLGEHPGASNVAAPLADLQHLPPDLLDHVALLTAHLARLVPGPEERHGRAWFEAVMAELSPDQPLTAAVLPDGEALALALGDVQSMSWMLRPVLMRLWVDAALRVGRRARLAPPSADALRLVAGLLDSPMPPDLSRLYNEVVWPA